MQLEQEQFAWLERVEILVRWRPEIDFAQDRLPAQHFEPIMGLARYVCVHCTLFRHSSRHSSRHDLGVDGRWLP